MIWSEKLLNCYIVVLFLGEILRKPSKAEGGWVKVVGYWGEVGMVWSGAG